MDLEACRGYEQLVIQLAGPRACLLELRRRHASPQAVQQTLV